MIPVRRCPGQVPTDERTDDLINVYSTILQEPVFASDQIAVQYDQSGRLFIEDLINDIDGIDILLRAPLIPGI